MFGEPKTQSVFASNQFELSVIIACTVIPCVRNVQVQNCGELPSFKLLAIKKSTFMTENMLLT